MIEIDGAIKTLKSMPTKGFRFTIGDGKTEMYAETIKYKKGTLYFKELTEAELGAGVKIHDRN